MKKSFCVKCGKLTDTVLITENSTSFDTSDTITLEKTTQCLECASTLKTGIKLKRRIWNY